MGFTCHQALAQRFFRGVLLYAFPHTGISYHENLLSSQLPLFFFSQSLKLISIFPILGRIALCNTTIIMKQFALIGLNILLTFLLFSYLYNPNKNYHPVTSQIQCMDLQGGSRSLCAQCVTRATDLDSSKGFLIDTKRDYAVLRFAYKQAFVTCKESLHLVDYSNADAMEIPFERHQPFGPLFAELQPSVIFTKTGKSIIQPQFGSFILYGWYEKAQKKGVEITYPNDNSEILKVFFYIVNVAVLAVIAGKAISRQDGEEIAVANYMVLFLVVGLELYTSSIVAAKSAYILAFIRVIFLTLSLVRVQIRKRYIFSYFLTGFIFVLHPLTLCFYTYIGWLLFLIGGWDKLSVEPIWRYLMVTQFIAAINYLLWYLLYQYEADAVCKIIELSQFSIGLLALALLSDRRVQRFKEYNPGDQKPIYLSGYDESQQMVGVR